MDIFALISTVQTSSLIAERYAPGVGIGTSFIGITLYTYMDQRRRTARSSLTKVDLGRP